jgi:hypothetical protein
MLMGVSEERLLNLSIQENRWLNNLKKSIYESDLQVMNGTPENGSFLSLCQGIDVAKKLRLSLQEERLDDTQNRQRFIDFLSLEIPKSENKIEVFNARKGRIVPYMLSEMIYDIRCIMVHENENLNHAENPGYHIELDWQQSEHSRILGEITGERKIVLNGRLVLNRIREVLTKFLMITELPKILKERGSWQIGNHALGSIRPD